MNDSGSTSDDPVGPGDSPAGGSAEIPEPPKPRLISPYVRSLDPRTAVRFGHQTLASTSYYGSQLLIRPTAHEELIKQRLTESADQHRLDVDINDVDERLREMAADAGLTLEQAQPLILRVTLLPRYGKDPVAPPDAWAVLQAYRSRFDLGDPDRGAVQLDHVFASHGHSSPEDGRAAGIGATPVTGTPYIHIPGTYGTPYIHIPGTYGTPYIHIPGTTGTPYIHIPSSGATSRPSELNEFAMPGFGGRTPVAFVGAQPERLPEEDLGDRRRPVIAVLDTGVGAHPWLTDGSQGSAKIIDRNPLCGELSIGLTNEATAPDEATVRINPLVGSLDATSGHGTFIAGLIRQKCPDANILAVRVIQGDGTVAEADLLEALNKLWLRQQLAVLAGRQDLLIDIVSISLGYYHEEPEDAELDPFLLAPIRALARLGVLVVTSAGNDATGRPMYPAAFAPWDGGPVKSPLDDETPVLAVGANNPDGSIALFSNEGPWVSAHRPGAALVSTMPPFDGSRSPTAELRRSGRVRATIDPDDFRSGFGMWSGTSFSAPILAGELAQVLHRGGQLGVEPVDPALTLDRAWQAIETCLPRRYRRPAGPSVDPADQEQQVAQRGEYA